MKRLSFFCTVVALSCLMATSADAQSGRGRSGGGVGSRGPGRANFPQVGSPVPIVSAFDANGKELSTKSFSGDYTVVVFGCLT